MFSTLVDGAEIHFYSVFADSATLKALTDWQDVMV